MIPQFGLHYYVELNGDRTRRSVLKRSESRKLLRATTCPVCTKEYDTPKVRRVAKSWTEYAYVLIRLSPSSAVIAMRPRNVSGVRWELRESQKLAVMPGLSERASNTACKPT